MGQRWRLLCCLLLCDILCRYCAVERRDNFHYLPGLGWPFTCLYGWRGICLLLLSDSMIPLCMLCSNLDYVLERLAFVHGQVHGAGNELDLTNSWRLYLLLELLPLGWLQHFTFTWGYKKF